MFGHGRLSERRHGYRTYSPCLPLSYPSVSRQIRMAAKKEIPPKDAPTTEKRRTSLRQAAKQEEIQRRTSPSEDKSSNKHQSVLQSLAEEINKLDNIEVDKQDNEEDNNDEERELTKSGHNHVTETGKLKGVEEEDTTKMEGTKGSRRSPGVNSDIAVESVESAESKTKEDSKQDPDVAILTSLLEHVGLTSEVDDETPIGWVKHGYGRKVMLQYGPQSSPSYCIKPGKEVPDFVAQDAPEDWPTYKNGAPLPPATLIKVTERDEQEHWTSWETRDTTREIFGQKVVMLKNDVKLDDRVILPKSYRIAKAAAIILATTV
ncbi:hypothetical protein BKA67DRAFT_529062 [Truncatella angustata]|uniref:Uncharacterized protein n=1 Tax=Truncatella angustata TaxID=152316 RepID=A0A9P8UUR1_9PEZI|nr:uncharacterized protein BKA67DRAFT_529062 [Truncatella angustata]KAH6658871.1 hypothetical protein BKA67DRAFT_529062 [Truncatella angustata]